jgi:hypothetical protein
MGSVGCSGGGRGVERHMGWSGGERGGGRHGGKWLGQCACPHSGGRRRVADERGLNGSRRARGREPRVARGPAREEKWSGSSPYEQDDF